MILFLHNRYRTTGGEERVVDELLELVRERLEEPAELLMRDSASVSGMRAAGGLLRGGLGARDVAKAVRLTGAKVVHAHNLNPLFGWRALAAARAEGARVVLHLHQYRLVCATGVCFTEGQECVRCHGRKTLPGVVHNCRGSRSEALAYGVSLALWQRRLVEQADAVIVPSAFARERLRALGAPLDWERVHVLAPPVTVPRSNSGRSDAEGRSSTVGGSSASGALGGSGVGGYALVVSRLAPEKGVDVAIDACRIAGVPLVVAGDGPQMGALCARAHTHTGHPKPPEVRFLGRVDDAELQRLRQGAALAIIPSRSAETFGMAAAEAMAAGLPVLASRIGALPELVEESCLVEPGDAYELAQAIGRLWGDGAAGERGRAKVRELCGAEVVAESLRRIYAASP